MYPVDLPDVDGSDLTSASEEYLTSLESRSSDNDEWLEVSQTSKARQLFFYVHNCVYYHKHEAVLLFSQVRITANNVKRLQLFEDDQPDIAVMALHPPDDPSQGFNLRLHTH